MKTLIKNVIVKNVKKDILIDSNKIINISTNIKINVDNIIDGEGLYAFSGNVNCYFNGNYNDCNNLLAQGITSVFDFSNDINITKKLVSLGIKVYSAVGDFNGNNIITEEYLDERVKEVVDAGVKCPILFLANPNIQEETQYEELIKYGKKHDLVLATSVSEKLEDVGEIDKKFGMSPIELLESYGFLDFKNMLIDCVYVDKEDVNILTNYDTTICTCPTKNLKDGSGIAPVYSFLKNHLNVVLGGDVKSIFQEVELCKNLQSGHLNEKDILSEKDVVPMININANRLFNNIGLLEIGCYADIILVDENSIIDCTTKNVKMSFVDGKLIYKAK